LNNEPAVIHIQLYIRGRFTVQVRFRQGIIGLHSIFNPSPWFRSPSYWN